MKKQLQLGVSGDIGSFSQEAAELYLKNQGIDAELLFLIDMESVLTAVEEGRIDRGIVPVVNFRGGLVKQTLEAMGKHTFKPIDEIWLNVIHGLMVRSNIPKEAIKKIISHPQALAQCEDYLKKHWSHVEIEPWIDTAKAAKDLSEDQLDDTVAAISPLRAGEIYQLNCLEKGIQDHDPNYTLFCVMEKRT